MKIYFKNFNSINNLKKSINKKFCILESDYYLTLNGKPLKDGQLINQNAIIDLNIRLKGGSELINNEMELRSCIYNSNLLNLATTTFNYDIEKTVTSNKFELNGNGATINGNLIIKMIGDIHISNIKINGRIDILATNIYLDNIINNQIVNLSSSSVIMNNSNYQFNDLFISGNLILNNNVEIKTTAIHLENDIIDNNYQLNIIQKCDNKYKFNSDLVINDPSLNLQKCLEATNITQAWKYCDYSKNRIIKVAVLDTGVDSDHPELIDNFLKDDNNNIIGKRFYDNKSDNNFDDDHGHGTHVAGIIAAKTNNNEGIAGISVNNKIKIIPVKCINKYSDGYYGNNQDISEAIKWAVDQGADIINLSLGGLESNSLIKNSVKYACKNKCLIISAVGNTNEMVEYPAALSGVLSVGCVDENNNMANFSSYKTDNTYPQKPEGHRGVDVVAPGLRIYSTFDNSDSGIYNNGFCYLTGTSMSTPLVTGIAALLMQQHDNYYRNPNIVRKIILHTSKNSSSNTHDDKYGYGIINAKDAILFPWTASFFNKLDSKHQINFELVNIRNQISENSNQIYNNSNQVYNNSNKVYNNSRKLTNDLYESIKSNSLVYGSGLALMLGYFYMNSSNNEDEWDNLTDDDIDSMSKDDLQKLEKILMKKI